MKVLLINFEMDISSPVLAWQARVAKELATTCESVHILTEKAGQYELAPNMTIDVIPRRPFGIPKSLGGGLFTNLQLYRLLKKHHCDVCFIHMAHKWAYRLWPVLQLNHLPVVIWYAHGSVSWHLKLATWCADKILTSTNEGFRLESAKKNIIGQAIDTDLFTPPLNKNIKPEIVYVGRISKRKRIDLLIDTFKALRAISPEKNWLLKIAGPTLTREDEEYLVSLKNNIQSLALDNVVSFTGSLTQQQTVQLYETACLHLNVSNTGSMDKTVMEALACGCPVVTTNEAFAKALQGMNGAYSTTSDPQELAQKIKNIVTSPPSATSLRQVVVGQHDLKSWIVKLSGILTVTQHKKVN